MMVLKGGQVYFDGCFQPLDIAICGDTISNIGIFPQENSVDCRECLLIPGLIDLHTHGCLGFDFADATAAQIGEMLQFYGKNGTTTLLATLVSLKKEAYFAQLPNLLPYLAQNQLSGLYLEGPFIAQNKRGSHNAENLSPVDMAFVRQFWEQSGGALRLMTAAPELSERASLLAFAKGRFTLSIGHTECDYSVARQALDAGFSHCTHLLNAMPALHHRAPGALGACLESNVTKELICDGVHLHDSVVRAMLKGYGSEIALVSDSISPCGMPNGTYHLGGLAVTVENHHATLADGTLAGSCSTLLDCVRHGLSIGCDMGTLIDCATVIPAKVLGLSHRLGRIQPGYQADLLILDKNWNLSAVYQKGVPLLL